MAALSPGKDRGFPRGRLTIAALRWAYRRKGRTMTTHRNHKRRLALLAIAVAACALATASAAQGAYLTLGTGNTSNAPPTLSGNTAGPELLVKNSNGTSASAFGLYGLLTATSPTAAAAAVRGYNSSSNALGYGIWGSQAGAGTGVYGTAATGIGVYGRHLGSTGTGPGVEGRSAAAGAAGVLGYNSAGGPGLQSIVSSNAIAPLQVNSTHVVPNLHAANSDQLGGKVPSGYWQLGGNAPGSTAVLGTTDNNALELKVNGSSVLRLEPNTPSPNVIAGFSGNGNPAASGAFGVVIAGGDRSAAKNSVTDVFGTVSGGSGNVAGDLDGMRTRPRGQR